MKISMRALFGWVAFAAFAVAALSQANIFWMRTAFSAAVLFTVYSCLAAVALRGERRMFWIGATLASTGYFLLVSGWPTNSNAGRFLLTQQLLEWITPNKGPLDFNMFMPASSLWGETLFDEGPQTPRRVHGGVTAALQSPEVVPVVYLQPVAPPADDPFDRPSKPQPMIEDDPFGPGASPPANQYPLIATTSFSPGRANRFYVIGHSLFVILFGLLGGSVTRRLAADQ